MFDDNNQSPAQPSQPINPTQPVNPIPVASMPVSTPSNSAQDMFSETEAPMPSSQAPIRPAAFQPIQPAPVASTPFAPEDGSGDNTRKFMVLGGLLLALAVLGVGGYFGYKRFADTVLAQPSVEQNKPAAEVPVAEKTDNQPAITGLGEENQVKPAEAIATTSEVAAPVAAEEPAKDYDDDGLTDEEESKIGSNPNLPDSDADGLFDRDEYKVYGTDPTKDDTDGDGYADGAEVKSGYNPLGAGKLFDPSNPAANRK